MSSISLSRSFATTSVPDVSTTDFSSTQYTTTNATNTPQNLIDRTIGDILQLATSLPPQQANSLIQSLPEWMRPAVLKILQNAQTTGQTPQTPTQGATYPTNYPHTGLTDLPQKTAMLGNAPILQSAYNTPMNWLGTQVPVSATTSHSGLVGGVSITGIPDNLKSLLQNSSVQDVLGMFGETSTGNQQADTQKLVPYLSMMFIAQDSWDKNSRSFKKNTFGQMLDLKKITDELKGQGLTDAQIKQVLVRNAPTSVGMMDSGIFDALLKVDSRKLLEGMGNVYAKTSDTADDALGQKALLLGLQKGVIGDSSSTYPSTGGVNKGGMSAQEFLQMMMLMQMMQGGSNSSGMYGFMMGSYGSPLSSNQNIFSQMFASNPYAQMFSLGNSLLNSSTGVYGNTGLPSLTSGSYGSYSNAYANTGLSSLMGGFSSLGATSSLMSGLM